MPAFAPPMSARGVMPFDLLGPEAVDGAPAPPPAMAGFGAAPMPQSYSVQSRTIDMAQSKRMVSRAVKMNKKNFSK